MEVIITGDTRSLDYSSHGGMWRAAWGPTPEPMLEIVLILGYILSNTHKLSGAKKKLQPKESCYTNQEINSEIHAIPKTNQSKNTRTDTTMGVFYYWRGGRLNMRQRALDHKAQTHGPRAIRSQQIQACISLEPHWEVPSLIG